MKRIAGQVDAFLVLTSTHSSNGMRLLELAEGLCGRAHRLESAADLDTLNLEGVRAVGITSAASTPDDLVQAVVERLLGLNPGLIVSEEGEWSTSSSASRRSSGRMGRCCFVDVGVFCRAFASPPPPSPLPVRGRGIYKARQALRHRQGGSVCIH